MSFTRPACLNGRTPSSGFTLLELLISIGIIVILCFMLAPAYKAVKEISTTTKCTNNLRNVFAMLASHAADHNGMINLHAWGATATPTTRRWNDFLVSKQYLPDRSNVQLCPGATPKTYLTNGYSYGVFGFADLEADPSSRLIDGMPNSRAVRLLGITSPASYWLMGDSWSSSLMGQVYLIRNDSDKTAGIHFRHQGKANVLFADGHVQGVTPAEAKKFSPNPLSYGFDGKNKAINF